MIASAGDILMQETLGFTHLVYMNESYFVDLNSEESRNKFAQYVRNLTWKEYAWTKETMGKHNWVMYNVAQYKVDFNGLLRLTSGVSAVDLPLNCSCCRSMFQNRIFNRFTVFCDTFDTRNVIDMEGMFENASFTKDASLPEKFIISNGTSITDIFKDAGNKSNILLDRCPDVTKDKIGRIVGDLPLERKLKYSWCWKGV